MNDKDNSFSLEQKIILWKHYDDHVNQIEKGLTNSLTVVSAVLTVLTSILGNTSKVIYVIPGIVIVFLYYTAYNQRVIEILRGYLLFIEDDILSNTKYNAMTWSQFGVLKNYNVNYFRAQLFAGPMYIIVFGGASVFTFYKLFSNQEPLYLVVTYLVLFLIFAIAYALDLSDNNYVAKTVYDKLKSGELDEKPKLERAKPIDIYIKFWKRR